MLNKSHRVADREKQRERSLFEAFTKLNRIMSGDLDLKVVAGSEDTMGTTPGAFSYPEIRINVSAFDSLAKTKTVVQMFGVNYHEFSHYLFTPRSVDAGFAQRAFNILEDQRIESLFSAMYGPAGKFFTEAVVRFFVEDQDNWPLAFLFTYGRSYLPLEIREEFEARFINPEDIEEAKELIDKYKTFRTSHFSTRRNVVKTVLTRFNEILRRAENNNGQAARNAECSSEVQQGTNQLTETDEQQEKEAQKKERRRQEKEESTGEDQSGFWDDDEEDEEEGEENEDEVTDDEDEDEGEDSEEGSDSDSEESDAGGDADSDSEDEEDGEGDGDSSSSDGEASDGDEVGDDEGESEGSGEQDGESDEEGGSQGVGGGGEQFSDDELADYLEEIAEAVSDDREVQKEVNSAVAAMNDNGNINIIDFGREPFSEEAITPAMSQTVIQVSKELQRLYAEVEPGWRYGSDVGRLNIDRAIHDPENYDEMFDEWDEGREHESGLEVVILGDLSTSMRYGNLIIPASQALWIVKRSLDDVDAKVTTLGFHASTVGLFSRNDKAPTTFWPLWQRLVGDTQPAQGMMLARSVLDRTDMPNKLFVMITDGQVGESDQEGRRVDLIELMDTIPGTTIYIGLGQHGNNPALEGKFDEHLHFNNPLELVDVVSRAVTKMLMESRR